MVQPQDSMATMLLRMYLQSTESSNLCRYGFTGVYGRTIHTAEGYVEIIPVTCVSSNLHSPVEPYIYEAYPHQVLLWYLQNDNVLLPFSILNSLIRKICKSSCPIFLFIEFNYLLMSRWVLTFGVTI